MKRRPLIVAALAVVAAACGADSFVSETANPQPATVNAEQLGALAAAQDRWHAAAPADYTVTQVDEAQDAEPRTLAVHDGEVVSLEGDTTTIEEVFVTIDQSIRDGAEVDVEYHSELGYPVRVVIDRDGDGTLDVDLELGDLEQMPIVGTLEELQAAQRRWDAQRLDSYRYLFRVDCTCPEGGTFEVEVRDGRVVAVTALDDAAQDSSIDPGVGIDAVFRDLELWFADSAELIAEGILDVDVRMDPEYGYPRWFRIQAEDLDAEFFAGPFTLVATLDLITAVDQVEPEPGPDPDDLAEVKAAHGRWGRAALSDYRYVVTVHCECPPEVSGPFEVTVRNGEVESAVLPNDAGPAGPEVILIEEAFERIGAAVLAGIDVDVVYDQVLGYPELALIDPEAVAVDGGLAFSISDVEVIE